MQSYYSWCGTPLHLILEDDLANAYNRATEKFFEAQRDHKARIGSPWEPTEPLLISWTEEEQTAHDAIGKVINLLCEINGGGISIGEEDLTSDFLVKL